MRIVAILRRRSGGDLPWGRKRPKRGQPFPGSATAMTRVRIEVDLKKGVTDPEGENVRKALNLLGFQGIRGVHSAKLFLVDVDAKGVAEARAAAEEMCRRLLANPVIHDYSIAVEEAGPAAPSARKASAPRPKRR